MKIIDISVPLRQGMVVWPGDRPVEIRRLKSDEEGRSNVSELCLSDHTGTHVDPPLHYVPGGRPIDELPLDPFLGSADVVDFPGVDSITAADLERRGIPGDCRRLLLRTRNSDYWARGDNEFHKDYVSLSLDGAEWVVRRGVLLVGIDYLSIAPYGAQGAAVHRALLGAGVIALETVNLSGVSPGRYQLACLPLLIAGGDGAPTRAVLWTDE